MESLSDNDGIGQGQRIERGASRNKRGIGRRAGQQIDNLIQVRLRKHGERISRDALPRGSTGAPHEMRHRAELAPGDELESLAGLAEAGFGLAGEVSYANDGQALPPAAA